MPGERPASLYYLQSKLWRWSCLAGVVLVVRAHSFRRKTEERRRGKEVNPRELKTATISFFGGDHRFPPPSFPLPLFLFPPAGGPSLTSTVVEGRAEG